MRRGAQHRMCKYYIAYGSNLNKRQMKMRCPTARIVGHGYLRDYTLVFRRFATIEKCIGEKVPVTVWYIDDESEKNLDVYEGYPGFYRKEYCNVEIEDEILCAIVYIMNSNMQFYELPDRRYLEVMVEGYSDMKHDRDYIYRALEKTRHEIENMMRSGGTINIPQKNMTHSMKLRPKPFENMAIGKKTIEYRLWDEKRRLMNPGDTIVFTNTETGERLKVRIKNIYRADTFGDLKKVLVANKITSANQFSPESMRVYYSEDDEEKYGVVGIEISEE